MNPPQYNPDIIHQGVPPPRPDYFCHKQLGGCGSAFYADVIHVEKDYEGDVISSTVACPCCKINVKVEKSTNLHNGKKELLYRAIDN